MPCRFEQDRLREGPLVYTMQMSCYPKQKTTSITEGNNMAPRIRLTKKQVLNICSRYKKGETLTQIASVYECSGPTIRNILIREGVEMRPRGVQPKKPVAKKKAAPKPAAEKAKAPAKAKVKKKSKSSTKKKAAADDE